LKLGKTEFRGWCPFYLEAFTKPQICLQEQKCKFDCVFSFSNVSWKRWHALLTSLLPENHKTPASMKKNQIKTKGMAAQYIHHHSMVLSISIEVTNKLFSIHF